MEFTYTSIHGYQKTLSAGLVKELRQHLEKTLGLTDKQSGSCTLEQLQDALISFESSKGDKLSIHQLYPVFMYVTQMDRLWPEEATE